jgi:hypothetical protein
VLGLDDFERPEDPVVVDLAAVFEDRPEPCLIAALSDEHDPQRRGYGREPPRVGGLLAGVLQDLRVRGVGMQSGQPALFGFLGERVADHERAGGIDARVDQERTKGERHVAEPSPR